MGGVERWDEGGVRGVGGGCVIGWWWKEMEEGWIGSKVGVGRGGWQGGGGGGLGE